MTLTAPEIAERPTMITALKASKRLSCSVQRDKPIESAPAVRAAFIAGEQARYSVASLNRSLSALRRACRLAYLAGWTAGPVHLHITVLPGESRRDTWCTPEEVERLVACAKYERTKDLILLLAYTGLRLGELLRLQPSDVRGGMIHLPPLPGSKAVDARTIPVHPKIRAAVKRLPLTGHRRTIQQSWQWARKKAGLEHVRLHDLRHTFGSWLASQNVSLPVIMELMGHKSLATAKRYLHLSTQAKKEAIGKI